MDSSSPSISIGFAMDLSSRKDLGLIRSFPWFDNAVPSGAPLDCHLPLGVTLETFETQLFTTTSEQAGSIRRFLADPVGYQEFDNKLVPVASTLVAIYRLVEIGRLVTRGAVGPPPPSHPRRELDMTEDDWDAMGYSHITDWVELVMSQTSAIDPILSVLGSYASGSSCSKPLRDLATHKASSRLLSNIQLVAVILRALLQGSTRTLKDVGELPDLNLDIESLIKLQEHPSHAEMLDLIRGSKGSVSKLRGIMQAMLLITPLFVFIPTRLLSQSFARHRILMISQSLGNQPPAILRDFEIAIWTCCYTVALHPQSFYNSVARLCAEVKVVQARISNVSRMDLSSRYFDLGKPTLQPCFLSTEELWGDIGSWCWSSLPEYPTLRDLGATVEELTPLCTTFPDDHLQTLVAMMKSEVNPQTAASFSNGILSADSNSQSTPACGAATDGEVPLDADECQSRNRDQGTDDDVEEDEDMVENGYDDEHEDEDEDEGEGEDEDEDEGDGGGDEDEGGDIHGHGYDPGVDTGGHLAASSIQDLLNLDFDISLFGVEDEAFASFPHPESPPGDELDLWDLVTVDPPPRFLPVLTPSLGYRRDRILPPHSASSAIVFTGEDFDGSPHGSLLHLLSSRPLVVERDPGPLEGISDAALRVGPLPHIVNIRNQLGEATVAVTMEFLFQAMHARTEALLTDLIPISNVASTMTFYSSDVAASRAAAIHSSPPILTQFALMATRNAVRPFSTAPQGLGVTLRVVHGTARILVTALSLRSSFGSISEWVRNRDPSQQDKGGLVEVHLQRGNEILLPPGAEFMVRFDESTVLHGTYFYSLHLFRRSHYARIHSFVWGMLLTPDRFEGSYRALGRLLDFVFDVLVLGKHNSTCSLILHMFDLSTMAGVFNFYSLLAAIFFSPALDPDTYLCQGQQPSDTWPPSSSQVERFVRHNITAVPRVKRMEQCEMNGKAFTLLLWFNSNYQIDGPGLSHDQTFLGDISVTPALWTWVTWLCSQAVGIVRYTRHARATVNANLTPTEDALKIQLRNVLDSFSNGSAVFDLDTSRECGSIDGLDWTHKHVRQYTVQRRQDPLALPTVDFFTRGQTALDKVYFAYETNVLNDASSSGTKRSLESDRVNTYTDFKRRREE